MQGDTFISGQSKPAFSDIEADELIKYLLNKTEQESGEHLDIDKMLKYLGLRCIEMDFTTEFDSIIQPDKMPRALISFPDKIIVVQKDLYTRRQRFSILHEIGHYILPDHRHDLFICSNEDFSIDTERKWESEANDFASEMLFLVGKLEKDAHQQISAKLVKQLGDQYLASYEATARRLVSKNLKPCMLLAFKQSIDNSTWPLKYQISSKAFKVDYFSEIEVNLDNEIASTIMQLGDVASSIETKFAVNSVQGVIEFNVELFTNTFLIFAFMIPT